VVDSTGSTPIDVELAEPVFDPSALHPILRALAVTPGARFVVPFFNHEGRTVRRDSLFVDGSEDVATDGGAVPAWRIRVHAGDRVATYYLAKRDPRELKVVVQVPHGEMRVLAPGVR
jgi:hypothetical protein